MTAPAPSETLTAPDLHALREAGVDAPRAAEQVRLLREGMRRPRLLRPATRGDGIETLDPAEHEALGAEFRRACAEGRWVHFIPASGAATRMAASLADRANLEQALKEQGKDPRQLYDLLGDPEVIKHLPKALIPFHRYPDGSKRMPLEEHVREAVALAPEAVARLHFTLSPEHESGFKRETDALLERLRAEGARAEVTFSFQDPSTQTLALDEAGEPFRDASGKLVLRPGGHGSLLSNLEGVARSLGADFAWVRNIDNIPVEGRRAEGRALRRALGGLLMRRARASAGDRPVRVCGMVENTGEPGGGPFWIEQEGGAAVRIVESAEVDASDADQLSIFRSATHFNPVDLACALRDGSGRAFALRDFADASACFIADKTHEGRALKALEWPGLWNGAMARWETHCVEIPVTQFAPVKTVLDLLRPEHQG